MDIYGKFNLVVKKLKEKTLKQTTIILSLLFVIGLIGTLIIVFLGSDSVFAHRFIIGYVVFIFINTIYCLSIILMRFRKLNGAEIRKRIFQFVITFAVCSTVSLGYHYFFKAGITNYYEIFPVPFALAIGINFIDLVYGSGNEGV